NFTSEGWTGGLHYMRNLLYAISVLEDREIELYFFVGNKVDEEKLIEPIKPYARVIRSSIVETGSIAWFIWKFIFLLTGSNYVFNRLMRKHKIEVVSHSSLVGRNLPYRLINWIPDFQHLHLPAMFSKEEVAIRSRRYAKIIRDSDCVVLSSKHAAADLCKFLPGYESKIRVLNFVSQPKLTCVEADNNQQAAIEEKYSFKGKFFYLPNQFWRHKNHQTVFEAVNILKEAGLDILILSSGHMDDYRNRGHQKKLQEYIKTHDLEGNIRLLGLIDYGDVFRLMRYSLAVINPSLFEGWSSTVEEAKSMGKGMILSETDVHREQAPPDSEYFDPANPQKLAGILRRYWAEKEGGPDFPLEAQARKMLPQRTRDFGLAYQNIVLEL
ncbi:glycosyltransferase family 4 protein, partial [bacterium]|nr:glycosyltransferase family 4 protein [bacterium]